MDKDDWLNVVLLCITIALLISFMVIGPLSLRGFLVTMYISYGLCALTMIVCTYMLIKGALEGRAQKA